MEVPDPNVDIRRVVAQKRFDYAKKEARLQSQISAGNSRLVAYQNEQAELEAELEALEQKSQRADDRFEQVR